MEGKITEHFPVKGLVRMGRVGYSSDRLEFDVFLRDFQRKNRSLTAKIPSRKRFGMGFSQVAVHALERA